MTTIDRSQESLSWSEVMNLTHATQVERFGWCSCEDNEGRENPYNDCPKIRAEEITGEQTVLIPRGEETLEIVGYFSYDCQPDGHCTYGCGKRPKTVCALCREKVKLSVLDDWHKGEWHEIKEAQGFPTDLCDECGEWF